MPIGPRTQGRAVIRQAVRCAEIIACAVSAFAVVAVAASLRPAAHPAGLILLLPIAWTGASFLLVVGPRTTPRPVRRSHAAAPLTVILRVGAEPDELVATAVATASRHGQVIVAATESRRIESVVAPFGVMVATANSIETAIHRAAGMASEDAVIIVSPLAMIHPDECARAAALLSDSVGWVTARTSNLHPDVVDPHHSRGLWALHRDHVRASGLILWESDATVIRTRLLLDHPFLPGRPWGAWLRARGREGHRGEEYRRSVASVSCQGGLETFWTIRAAQQSALAADLGDAVARAPDARHRALALGLLLGELRGVALVAWLSLPLIVASTGSFPLRMSAAEYVAIGLVAATSRLIANLLRYGSAFHPLRDALIAAYDAPGSVVAVWSALRRRRRLRALHVPQRLIVWTVIPFTLLALSSILDHDSIGDPSLPVAAGLALPYLAILWTLLIRGRGLRRSARRTVRFPITVPVRVDGFYGETLDASASGLAIACPGVDRRAGDEVDIEVEFSHGSILELHAVVRRTIASGANTTLMGLWLRLDHTERAAWIRALLAESEATSIPLVGGARARGTPGADARTRASLGDRLTLAFAATSSVLIALALLLPAVDLHPLIIRSGSMRPTYQVGDIVVDRTQIAEAFEVGDVVTFPDPYGRGDRLTHRVRAVVPSGNVLAFETRGDANQVSEHWYAAPSDRLGRAVTRIPAVGLAVVAGLGRPLARSALLVTGIVAAVLLGLAAWHSLRRIDDGPAHS